LNLDEYVNNELKGSVNAEVLPHNQADVQAGIEMFMAKWLRLPEPGKTDCQQPCTPYAAAMEL
jgi:hypothetical protein